MDGDALGERIRGVERTTLFSGWARIERASFDYRHRDGRWERQTREIYHRGHGAALLLYAEAARRVILIRQFRFPVWSEEGDGFVLEAPAGVVEADDPAETVRREAMEETGYRVGTVRRLFEAYVSPGSVTERIHYFAAPYDTDRRTGEGGGRRDEGEDIEVLEYAFDDAFAAITDGRIRDAKTMLLLQWAALNVFTAEPMGPEP